ncbi:MAG: hypothetical protein KC620_19855 [Myxococcales bacterium]|nr:hypothetical protein [Myxococcales bacterium]
MRSWMLPCAAAAAMTLMACEQAETTSTTRPVTGQIAAPLQARATTLRAVDLSGGVLDVPVDDSGRFATNLELGRTYALYLLDDLGAVSFEVMFNRDATGTMTRLLPISASPAGDEDAPVEMGEMDEEGEGVAVPENDPLAQVDGDGDGVADLDDADDDGDGISDDDDADDDGDGIDDDVGSEEADRHARHHEDGDDDHGGAAGDDHGDDGNEAGDDHGGDRDDEEGDDEEGDDNGGDGDRAGDDEGEEGDGDGEADDDSEADGEQADDDSDADGEEAGDDSDADGEEADDDGDADGDEADDGDADGEEADDADAAEPV